MKITKQELKDLDACAGGYIRFIKQTNDTSEPVEVSSLVGGLNTYSDLLWLAGKKLSREVIVRFACDCALINVELIKQYTDKYEEIVAFLKEPTDDYWAAGDAAAVDAAWADAAARAAARATVSAARSTRAVVDTAATARAADAADAAARVSPESKQKVDQLLIALFS